MDMFKKYLCSNISVLLPQTLQKSQMILDIHGNPLLNSILDPFLGVYIDIPEVFA